MQFSQNIQCERYGSFEALHMKMIGPLPHNSDLTCPNSPLFNPLLFVIHREKLYLVRPQPRKKQFSKQLATYTVSVTLGSSNQLKLRRTELASFVTLVQASMNL